MGNMGKMGKGHSEEGIGAGKSFDIVKGGNHATKAGVDNVGSAKSYPKNGKADSGD